MEMRLHTTNGCMKSSSDGKTARAAFCASFLLAANQATGGQASKAETLPAPSYLLSSVPVPQTGVIVERGRAELIVPPLLSPFPCAARSLATTYHLFAFSSLRCRSVIIILVDAGGNRGRIATRCRISMSCLRRPASGISRLRPSITITRSSSCACGSNGSRLAASASTSSSRSHRPSSLMNITSYADTRSTLPRCVYGDIRLVRPLTTAAKELLLRDDPDGRNGIVSLDDQGENSETVPKSRKESKTVQHESVSEEGKARRRRRRKGRSPRKIHVPDQQVDTMGRTTGASIAYDEPPRYQSRRNSELLFTSFAPHVDKNAMAMLRSRLRKFAKAVNRNLKHYDERQQRTGGGKPKGQLKRLFSCANSVGGKNGRGGRMEMLDAVVDDILKVPQAQNKGKKSILSPETHGWMKPLLLNYFANHKHFAHKHDKEGVDETGGDIVCEDANEDTTSAGDIAFDEAWNGSGERSISSDDRSSFVLPTDAKNILLSEPSFPSNVNRRKIADSDAIETLMRSREKCLGSDPLFWSRKKAKNSARSQARREKMGQLKKEKHIEAHEESSSMDAVSKMAVEDLTVQVANSAILADTADPSLQMGSEPKRSRINIIRARHAGKTPEELQREAEVIAQLLADRLPSISFERLLDQLELYVYVDGQDENVLKQREDNEILTEASKAEVLSASKARKKKKRTSRILPTILRSSVKDHMHLVAADMAEFLYVGIPELVREKDTASAAAEMGSKRKKDVHSFDDRMNTAWVEWTKTRDEVASAFMEAQHVLVAVENLWRKEAARRMEEANDDEEDGVESLFASLKKETEQKELIHNLQATIKRKGPHAIFDAMLLNDRFSTASTSVTEDVNNDSCAAQTDRTVLVDCLPIDVTEAEIRELYSRCGPIESVRLFNLRPDLDPGPPSPAQLMKQRKKRRRAGAKQLKRRAERKRSPVYAMVTFESEEGCKMASIDQLRIFGMVIRRYPARSICAQEATTLHLENIPKGLYSLDLEQKLSRALHPDMYIGLDVGQNDYAKPASCEIRFPNFEAAFRAYTVLEGLLSILQENQVTEEGPRCALHWMKTPADSLGYWTRQLSFDV